MAPKSALAVSAPLAQEKRAFLPYGRQCIEADDIAAVIEALKSDYLTTGPMVERFESELVRITGAAHAIACSNGTSALYLAAKALHMGEGSMAVVPAITFLATASGPHMAGADILFTDVDPDTGLMRVQDIEAALARVPAWRMPSHVDAVFPVHFAGQSCDVAGIAELAQTHHLRIVEDAAHALGTAWREPNGALVPVGACAHSDLVTFSFHPVKTIAMGEGGAVMANDPALARRLKNLRNHGITRDTGAFVMPEAFDANGAANPWFYELTEPGFNWRVPDINCALGLAQLEKLPRFIEARRELVHAYDALLAPFAPLVRPLGRDARSHTAWHIYAAKIDFAEMGVSRADVMRKLAADGIGTQVHYIPVHRQPYYRARYGDIHLPGADAYYKKTFTLPLFPAMCVSDVERVVERLAHHLGL